MGSLELGKRCIPSFDSSLEMQVYMKTPTRLHVPGLEGARVAHVMAVSRFLFEDLVGPFDSSRTDRVCTVVRSTGFLGSAGCAAAPHTRACNNLTANQVHGPNAITNDIR